MSDIVDVTFEEEAEFDVDFSGTGKDGEVGGYYIPSGSGGVLNFTPSRTDMPEVPSVKLPEGPQGEPFTYEDFTEEQLAALAGSTVVSLKRTSGTGAAGTTDTYTMTMSDGKTFSFQVYNGADGKGVGDMLKSSYDPQNKNTDIFDYVDKKIENLDVDVTADEVTFSDGQTFQQKYDNGELNGTNGKDATINGVNALTLTTDEYLSLEQTGSTAKLSMKSAPASLTTVTAVLSSSAWALDSDGLYAQTVAVEGVTTDPNQVIVADVQQTGTDLDADNEALAGWAGEDGKGPSTQYVTQGNGTLTFHAIEAPTVNIPINVGVG